MFWKKENIITIKVLNNVKTLLTELSTIYFIYYLLYIINEW